MELEVARKMVLEVIKVVVMKGEEWGRVENMIVCFPCTNNLLFVF